MEELRLPIELYRQNLPPDLELREDADAGTGGGGSSDGDAVLLHLLRKRPVHILEVFTMEAEGFNAHVDLPADPAALHILLMSCAAEGIADDGDVDVTPRVPFPAGE